MSLKQTKKEAKRKLVGEVSELTPGMTKKFTLSNGKYSVEGMLLNYQGSLYAYVNRCPHIGISLDWVDNQFFTIDGRYLMCANHGATFEPATGECIWGPSVPRSRVCPSRWRVKRSSCNTRIGDDQA